MESSFCLADAEKTFKDYGCKHFYMAKEDSNLYLKYSALNIPKEQEMIWATESYEKLASLLIDRTTVPAELWSMYSRAIDLVETSKLLQMLENLSEISLKILEKVPASNCIICAESILGRKDVSYKEGVIFLSLKEYGVQLANNFLELAGRYIQRHDNGHSERSVQALKRVEEIRSVMGLN
ncbi:hypothetical protein D3C72_84950 [compost metagenome]